MYEIIYRMWLSANQYNIKKIETNSDIILESDLAIGAIVDIKISSNAYFLLDIKIRKNNVSVNKNNIEIVRNRVGKFLLKVLLNIAKVEVLEGSHIT